jgi:tetratricopeptide (TPR) repeat protein
MTLVVANITYQIRTTNDLAARGAATNSLKTIHVIFGILVIATITFVVYLPSLKGSFILDDNLLLTDNVLIKAPNGLYRLWFSTEGTDYWPVTYSSLWFEWRMWGMNPVGYRLTNLLLHIIDSLLIWQILRKLSIPGCFLAALLFAVHPINVESVAWIAQRKNLLALLFFVLSILFYLNSKRGLESATRAIPKRSFRISVWIWYWLSVAAFLLAMLSKGSVAIQPLVLLLIAWWQRRTITLDDLLAALPFFLVATVLTGVNLWYRTHGAHFDIRSADLPERLAGAGAAVWFYLSKALFPIDLTFIYPAWQVRAADLRWWIPLLAAAAVTVVLSWQRNRSWGRSFLFAWGFYCIALLPVLGFTDVGFMQFSLVADHYQHIALISIVALASGALVGWSRQTEGIIYVAIFGIAIILVAELGFMTWQRSLLFGEPRALYESTLDKNPNCWPVHNDLGSALLAEGNAQDAAKQFLEALRLNPDLYEAHDNLGNALAAMGRSEAAMKEYQEAIHLNPAYTQAHFNLALQLMKLDRPAEAVDHLLVVLRYDPYDAEACFDVAKAQEKMHNSEQAIIAGKNTLSLARSQGRSELAHQIQEWLDDEHH